MSNENFHVSKRHAAARALASDGVPVFPVEVNGKRPVTPNGYKDATTDLSQIDAWWSAADYNYAYRPADLGCVVLDLDLHKGIDPATLATIPEDTYTVLTPSGGEHRYFATDAQLPNSKLAPAIDVRCANGYVLGPGSVINGAEYRVKEWR